MSLYFDHAASTPPTPEALKLFSTTHQTYFANPSSLHEGGRSAKKTFEALKESFCQQLSFFDGLFTQTSSATEANNTVITSFLQQNPDAVICIGIDTHSSIWYITDLLPQQCNIIDINENGQYDWDSVNLSHIKPTLILINYISQDLGTIHDSKKWHRLAQLNHCHLHIDATQAFGKIDINCEELAFHTMSASAHKFGGTRGCGILLSKNTHINPFIHGGSQQDNLRAGTENLAALAAAQVAYQSSLNHRQEHYQKLDRSLEEGLKKIDFKIIYNKPSTKLAGINNISCPGYLASELVTHLSIHDIHCSTGSACSESQSKASRAVLAFGRSEEEGLGSLRISFGPEHQKTDITTFLTSLENSLKSLSSK